MVSHGKIQVFFEDVDGKQVTGSVVRLLSPLANDKPDRQKKTNDYDADQLTGEVMNVDYVVSRCQALRDESKAKTQREEMRSGLH